MNQKYKYLKLVGSIEKWMESGEPILNLKFMLDAVDNDISFLTDYLNKWNENGKIEWMHSLDPNEPLKPVVRFSHYISKHVPWKKF